ncbi:MAG: hypothetical protein PHU08_05130 [Dehalococcoidales bacterium]|nr:hypothetical protein [Dehalococcoidales bacterium]
MAWKKILLEGDAAELSDTAPIDVLKQTASAGVATKASRQDHAHDVTTAVPSAAVDGGAADEGTATSLVRSDHKHALGPLVADLDFAQNMADGVVLEAVDTPPDSGAEVEAQVYFDTGVGNKHLYVWVP